MKLMSLLVASCYLFWGAVLLSQSPESLLIGPGDLVHVIVFDSPELEQKARVSDAGEMHLLMGGTVKLVGLTPIVAASIVEDALRGRHIMRNPSVQISIEEYATGRVSVFGEVRSPGAYAVPTPRSILDVLTLAGGLTENADRHIVVKRHGTSEKLDYFVSNDPSMALDKAPSVYSGDTVLIAKAAVVYVLGDVKLAGGYTMTNNESQLSVLQLIARAGGTPPTAAPSHSRLIRHTATGYTNMPLPLSAMQKGKSPDIALEPGDIVYVPFSYLRNLAFNSAGIAATAGNAAIYRF